MPEERRLHCPRCGSQLWKVPKGKTTLPMDTPFFTCAKCGVTSPHEKIVSAYHHEHVQQEEEMGIGNIDVKTGTETISEIVNGQRQNRLRLKVLEKLVEMNSRIPLTQQEKNDILLGAPVDFVKMMVYRKKPDPWGLVASTP